MALEDILEDLGCAVAGLAASVAEALSLIETGAFDVALIDLHLGAEMALPVAAAARAKGKAFAFASGTSDIPPEFADIMCVAKPYKFDSVAAGLASALAGERG
jgi:CheY-like chemotaxis protein